MKTVHLTGIRQLEISDIKPPQIKNPTDVLLKIEAVGLCGSDIHYFQTGKIGDQVVQYPFTLGHECACCPSNISRFMPMLREAKLSISTSSWTARRIL